jgi:hypothetical protein
MPSGSAPGRSAAENRDRFASFQCGIWLGRVTATGGDPESEGGAISLPAGDGRYPPLDDDERPEDGDLSLVRPYAVTGGRTKPRYQLEIEAMVAATYHEPRDLSLLDAECRAIVEFCRDWQSVAEISAVLRMPLGVARILIADLAADGLVRIHQLNHAQGGPSVKLLERVLSGLRRL